MKSTAQPAVRCFVITCCVLLLTSSVRAKEQVTILDSGKQAGHYLVWDGQPILPIGDSVTQGWMESGTNFNQHGYIDAISSRGINVAMIWSYIGTTAAGQQGDARIGYDSPEIQPWKGSTDTGSMDLTQLNQAYFDRLKSFVSYAESKDVLVLITVHDGGPKWRFDRHPFKDSLGNGPLTAASQYVELADYDNEMPAVYNASWNRRQKNQYFQERFADKLITELEPYSNVIYEMFNEGEWYDHSDRREHEEHFLRFFRARTDALLTSNLDHVFDGFDPHENDDVDMCSLHGGWTGRHAAFVAGFNKTPAKPYFQSEPVPEFDGTNLTFDTIRQSAWEQALAGAGWVAQNDTSFGWDPNAAIVSQAANRDKAYDQIGYVATFFNDKGVKFWNMAPNPALSSTGIVLADPAAEYVVYAHTGGTFTVDLSAAGGETFEVQWYNPRTGALTSESSVTGGSNNASFTAPNTQDWVLWLRVETEPIEGDLNGDGFVGSGDLDVVRGFWGQALTPGDLRRGDPSGDGLVGGADLDIVRANWGRSNTAAANTVPEPSTVGLLATAAAALLFKWSCLRTR